MLSERIQLAGSFPQFCSGFTNTCNVNEVGAISVVPEAWIVLERLHVKRKTDNIFAGKFQAV